MLLLHVILINATVSYPVFPTRLPLSFNGYQIPRLDLLPLHAPMNISLLYFAISIGFQWNIALYTKLFSDLKVSSWTCSRLSCRLDSRIRTISPPYDHLPNSKLFRYLYLPVHMDNGLFAMLHPNSGIIYHIMLKTLRLLVNLNFFENIFICFGILWWMTLLVLIFMYCFSWMYGNFCSLFLYFLLCAMGPRCKVLYKHGCIILLLSSPVTLDMSVKITMRIVNWVQILLQILKWACVLVEKKKKSRL